MVSEVEISRTVGSHYRSNGFFVKTEVPLLSKRVDVAAYDSALDILILVEAKVSDWRSAVRQATIYTLCTPNAYIAVSKRYSHRVDLDIVRDLGLGMLEVDGKVRCTLEPSGICSPQPSVRKSVIEFLRPKGDSSDF